MKFFHRLLGIITFVLFTLSTFAQQRHPIQVVTQFQTPHTVSVPQWYGGPVEKLSVWLTNQDLQQTAPTPVYLKLKITGPGVSITSKPNVNYPIIQLEGGVPVRLSLDDLAPYLNPRNWNFESGLTYDSYVRSYTLPEGYYTVSFEAIKQGTPAENSLWSNVGSAQVFLTLNDPPFLNLPRKGESIIHREPANIIFQWTPRHMADPYLVQNTEYEFSMLELIDNGMAPEVAFMQNGIQPFYQERSMASTFVYGPQYPLLTPGRRYAWRICVKAADGTNLSSFKNDGCSEVYWFTYQDDCKPPISIQAEAMTEAARITWTPVVATMNATGLGGNYVVEYREHKLSPTDWNEMHTATNRVTLANLNPDRTYEFRVGRSCDDNLTFVYSDVQRFKTNAHPPQGNCGEDDSPPPEITNREPIQTLHAGDIITGGGGSVKLRIVQVTGQGNFTGYGYMTFPLFRHAQIKAKFENIIVNTDKQLIGGTFNTTYDKEEKQIADLDKIIERGQTAAVSQNPIPAPQHTVSFEITDPEAIQISEDNENKGNTGSATETTTTEAATIKLSIKNTDGSVKEIKVASLPATIQDSNNTIYKVEKDKNGKTLVSKVGQQTSRPNSTLATNTTKASVQFKNYPEKQLYAFDEYQPAYSKSMLYKPKYESIADNYFVSSKAIVSGQTDVVKAVLTTSDKTIVADSVRFVNNQGLRYPSTIIGNNTFEITVTGGPSREAQELYAVYPQGKSTISLGKLLITSYPAITRKVVLVSVNNASIDKSTISQQLNAIYNPIGVNFEVSEDASFDDMSWDSNADGKLATKGSGLFSTLTPEMKALNQAYTRSRTVQTDALYLFVLSSADEAVVGDMPRGKQFGYLFTGDDGRVAAHEIGHGLFKLKHTFDGYGFTKGELANNLMDYPAGASLNKYQWDQIHDPGIVIGVFEKETDGELAKNIASIEKKSNFCETEAEYYKGLYDGALEGGKDALKLLTIDGLTDFAKGVSILVWHWNPFNWSNEAVTFRDKMVTQVGTTLKKMVITDNCYQSGRIWGNTIIGIFGTEGLVAVGKGAIKLGKLTSVSAQRIAKISDLSQEVALTKIGKKVAGVAKTGDELLNAFINGWKKEKILALPKGKRPDPSTYLKQSHIEGHLSKFNNGASYLVPKESLDKYGRSMIGRPDGQFVMSKIDMDDLLSKANGDLSIVEMELGIPKGLWKNEELVRIDIPNPKQLNVRIPNGNEGGANELWLPGGKLPNGYSEAVINQIPKGSYNELQIKIK